MTMKVLAILALVAGTTNAFVPKAIITSSRRVQQDSTSQLQAAFGLFKRRGAQNQAAPAPEYDNVAIEPDFRLAGTFLAVGGVLDQIPYLQWSLGFPATALGALFLVQTFRIRFDFDKDNFMELKTTTVGNDKVYETGDNIIIGGANRWSCDAVVNYEFFPKGWIDNNPVGPVLVYMKETQTPKETWNDGPGKAANDPKKIAAGKAAAGQVHFFPVVCNAQQMRAEFEKRGCKKMDA